MPINELWKKIKSDPFSVFGPQPHGKGWSVKLLNNAAASAVLIDGDNEYYLDRDEYGFFNWTGDHKPSYAVRYGNSYGEWTELDPYTFPPVISDYDLHLFKEGTHRRIWEVLGAHPAESCGVWGTVFSVWAPNAVSVRLVGDFNGWDDNRYYMRARGLTGVWEIFIPNLSEPSKYKYAVESFNGSITEKSDPYAFFAEKRPDPSAFAVWHSAVGFVSAQQGAFR